MIVKICGITTKETAHVVAANGADWIGFVFAPSKRQITVEHAKEIVATLPASIKKVGVFVNESLENMIEIAQTVPLDIIQLHGDEPKEIAEALPYPVIRACTLEQINTTVMKDYPCDYVLIDSPGTAFRGGSGIPFDWSQMEQLEIAREKLILAGGLSPENIKQAIQTVQPTGVDVSSGVETDEKKDHEKIKRFLLQAKKTNM